MKRIAVRTPSPLSSPCHNPIPPISHRPLRQCLHTTSSRPATILPITASGPPPAPPVPAASQYGERVDRRRRQAALLKQGIEMRAGQIKPGSAMKKRFWKDVHIIRDEDNNISVALDTRTVRNPLTKDSLLIPPSKPHLAIAIALEWDLLVSSQQAARPHLIPLTSMASRAQSLVIEDSESKSQGFVAGGKGEGIRYDIVNQMLRYLDTDTLLCWAPPHPSSSSSALSSDADSSPSNRSDPSAETDDRGATLRDTQIRTAKPIIAYLTQRLWPGVELKPSLDDGTILPRSQPPSTRAVVKGWMAGLPAWELVALERAVLASKSLCVGARLVCEWSEALGLKSDDEGRTGERFGIEKAAEACSLEVRWQTGRWGEVEDTHDVDKEDVRRQLGSVVMLVSGRGEAS